MTARGLPDPDKLGTDGRNGVSEHRQHWLDADRDGPSLILEPTPGLHVGDKVLVTWMGSLNGLYEIMTEPEVIPGEMTAFARKVEA